MSRSARLLLCTLLTLCSLPALAQTTTTRAPRSTNLSWTAWAQQINPSTGATLSSWQSLGEVKATLVMSEPSQGSPRLTATVNVVPATNTTLIGAPTVTCGTYPPTTTGSGPYARCDITVTLEQTTNVGSYRTSNTWMAGGEGSTKLPVKGVEVNASAQGEFTGVSETIYTPRLRITRSYSVGVQLYNSCQSFPGYSLYVTGSNNYRSYPKRIPSTCLYTNGNSQYCGTSTDRFTGNRFVSESGASNATQVTRTYRRPDGTTFQKLCFVGRSSCHAFAHVDWMGGETNVFPFVVAVSSANNCSLGAERFNYNHSTGLYDIRNTYASFGGCSCASINWNP